MARPQNNQAPLLVQRPKYNESPMEGRFLRDSAGEPINHRSRTRQQWRRHAQNEAPSPELRQSLVVLQQFLPTYDIPERFISRDYNVEPDFLQSRAHDIVLYFIAADPVKLGAEAPDWTEAKITEFLTAVFEPPIGGPDGAWNVSYRIPTIVRTKQSNATAPQQIGPRIEYVVLALHCYKRRARLNENMLAVEVGKEALDVLCYYS